MIVICGYPGIGTNRYRRFLTGETYDEIKTNYDSRTNSSLDKFTHKGEDIVYGKIYTTHCMNTTEVRRDFPGFEVHKIWTENLDISLLRFWDVFWKNNVEENIANCFDVIVFYKEYYKNVDKDCDILIDIENDFDEFSLVMRRELKTHSNVVFDEALSIYDSWGKHAPVNDIVNGLPSEVILESYRLNIEENA